jgi:hypothetical protein
VLGDATWATAEALDGFTQKEPTDGAPASEPTEVRLLWDDDALYVGVWLHDSRPAAIVEGERQRDYSLQDSDAVLLILDTFGDEQNGFVFGTNPTGIEYDGQVANEGRGGGSFLGGGLRRGRFSGGSGGGLNVNWDGRWRVATSRDEGGWYAEFAIPFSTLRYGEGTQQAWGFNIMRRLRRQNETSFWAPVPRQFDLYRLNYAGTLTGLEPPTQRFVQVTPYALQSAARDWQAGDPDMSYPGEVGGDAKLKLTQGLTLDLTYNTDFAQVEVDEAQVNLSRFNISFPEKRPFFLENAGFFSVGGGNADLFFSRRVGIADNGTQLPILGGGRVSGRAAGLNVGLLHIRTEGLEGVQPENAYSVARLARELPNRSRVGAAFVERSAVDVAGDHNRTYALDGQLGLGEAVTLSGFWAQSETPGLDGREYALDAVGSYTDRDWNATLQYRRVGEDFNPEVGFLPRAGYDYGQAFVMRYLRPEGSVLREIRPHVSFYTYRDVDTGFDQSSRLHVDSHWEFQSGAEIHTGANWVAEGIEADFEVPGSGVVVPPGSYQGWEGQFVFNSNESADLSFSGRVTGGSFLSGERLGGNVTVTFRQGARLSTALQLDHNDVRLPQGDFTTTLAGVRTGFFVTPRISVQALVQYADQIDIWSANVRFAWLETAGTGLFVVYNQANGLGDLARDTPLNRSLVVKFTRTFDVLRW